MHDYNKAHTHIKKMEKSKCPYKKKEIKNLGLEGNFSLSTFPGKRCTNQNPQLTSSLQAEGFSPT